MPGLSQVKVGLAVIGLLVFAAGARLDSATLRWIAIGIMAVAFLMRFAKRPDR